MGVGERRDQPPDRGREHLPIEDAVTRRVGAVSLEQDDESAVQRTRYMTQEIIAQIGGDAFVSLSTLAA